MIKTIRNSFVECKMAIGLILILINLNLHSQTNLVPNPSFENFGLCPTFGVGEICEIIPWFDAVANCFGSSDFFHPCTDPFSGGGAPSNFAGYQTANVGNGYSGILIYQGATPNLWREYLEIKLNSILQLDKKYCTNWNTSLADISRYGSNKIGAHFSIDTLFQTGSQFDYINVIPQVEDLGINVDTAKWTLFKQIYTAQGFEQFMTVGNFRPGSMTDTSNTINSGGAWAYYYFDDFGVYELPEIDAGLSGEICEYGGSVELQANCLGCWGALKYRWWPAEGLSETSILNPVASPEQTTTYYFGLIDTTETVPCIVDLVDSATVTVCAGIEPPVFNFTIQPNPGNAQIELVFTHVAEDTKLYLYDMRGRLVLEDVVPKGAQNHVLNIQQLANAQYILKLENSEEKLRKKFVKM